MEQIGSPSSMDYDSLFDHFWNKFSLFGSRFDEFCLRYWYILILIFCLLLFLLDIGLDYHNKLDFSIITSLVFKNTHFYRLGKHKTLSLTAYDFTNWVLISQGLTLALEALAFNRWRRRIRATFTGVYKRGHICCIEADKHLPEEYLAYLEKYQQALKSKWRFILMIPLLLLTVAIILSIIVPRVAQIPPTSDVSFFLLSIIRWPLLEICISGILIIYLVTACLWATAVTGWYIRKLTMEFNLVIYATHPDKCGGLKFLGSFCLNLALPILIAILVLGTYGIGFTLFYRGASINFILAANAFLLFVAVPLAIFAFLVPLLHIHRDMLKIREKNEDKLSSFITDVENSFETSLKAQDWTGAKDVKERLQMLEDLLTDNFGYLTWPFNIRILLIFLTPQIITLMSVIVGFDQNGPLATALKAILSILGVGRT